MRTQDHDAEYFSEHDTYLAPGPRTRWTTWLKRIIARIIFTPILLWDLLKLCARQLVGNKVGNLIFRAQSDPVDDLSLPDEIDAALSRKKIRVVTYDHAELDTREIQNRASLRGKYIVYFPGRGATMENTLKLAEKQATEFQCNVVIGNYRGVQHSTGKAKFMRDLVTDGIAQTQRLIDMGVPADKITLVGYSFGSSVSAKVARYFHQQKQKVSLFCDRGFSNSGNLLVGWLRGGGSVLHTKPPAVGHKESLGGKILGWLMKPLFKLVLYLTQWHCDTEKAFRAVPASHKEYIVVRSSKQQRQSTMTADDTIIPHFSSLHAALRPERKQQKSAIDKRIHRLQTITQRATQSTALIQTQLAGKILPQLQEARASFLERKMIAPDLEQENDAHFVDWDTLRDCRNGKPASDFFRRFFNREQLAPEPISTTKTCHS